MKLTSVLDALHIPYLSIELGELITPHDIDPSTKRQLQDEIHKFGFEILDDERTIMIERIITVIIDMVHYSKETPKDNFSDFLSEKLDCDYAKVSHLFSKTKGTTIEHFIILHKIERIKELILYDDLNLSEIADLMNYKSLSHLSKQFKQITSLTPTFFKNLPRKNRINLEDI
jgi:AraC-like DNA-binding protein